MNPAQSAPEPRNVQQSSSGEDATKRSHDSIVYTGHKVHPYKIQRMNNPAVAQEELPEAEPVKQDNRAGTAWHARYMQRQREGTPNSYELLRMQANANLPNQGVNTQSDQMNQSSSVDNAFTQAEAFHPLENYNSVVHVPSVHMGQPQNPYSPIGREYAQ
jgi:hypothetical protein